MGRWERVFCALRQVLTEGARTVETTFPTERPVDALFPPGRFRRHADATLTDRLSAARERVARGSVVPTFDLPTFRAELATFDFASPRPFDEAMEWTIRQMERGLVHVSHPRYFGLFNPTPTFPAQCAERIAAIFNPQLATFTTSPAAVEIEAHVIRSAARRLGFSQAAAGHFTTGGAEANYTGLLLALTHACPDFAADGARAFSGRPMFYVSQDSHLAWLKIAHQAGIGRASVRLVATDGTGRMDADALASAIDQDRAQAHQPVMIVATAGTTNAGMIDPIAACADLADATGLWLHVDAAWGGGIAASRPHTGLLDGIVRAHSVTVDAHKWFATTMGCGMFITRRPDLLGSTFHVATGYMPSRLANDPYVTTVQWSRRFLGLRLFLSLAVAGWEGHAAHVERCLRLAEDLRQCLVASGWHVVNRSSLGVLCIRPPSGDVREIVEGVLASGHAWVSVAMFEGSDVIRACITSGETTKEDVEELVRCLQRACGAVSERPAIAR
jgi:glutamate/tyrosine decarboxylase-like PLP-dependent enzyme